MATPITKVWGIGVRVAEVLAEYGYKYAEDLLSKGEGELVQVPGFGSARAGKVLRSAHELLNREAAKKDEKVAEKNPESRLGKKKKKKTKKEGKKKKKLEKESPAKPKKKKKTAKKSKKKKGSSKKKK